MSISSAINEFIVKARAIDVRYCAGEEKPALGGPVTERPDLVQDGVPATDEAAADDAALDALGNARGAGLGFPSGTCVNPVAIMDELRQHGGSNKRQGR